MMNGTLQTAAACGCASFFMLFPAVALSESVRDNGMSNVNGSGLASLRGKVSGRDDLAGRYQGETLSRFDTESDGTYFFTEPDASAHPFAMYCGRDDSGMLEIRAWRAGDMESAQTLRTALAQSIRKAGDCVIEPD